MAGAILDPVYGEGAYTEVLIDPEVYGDPFAETGAVTGSFTADAVLKKTISASFTADAVLQKTFTGSFTADAELVLQQFSFTGDAVLKKTQAAALTADAILFKTTTASFTADAFLARKLTADAVLKKTQSASFTADAILKKTITNAVATTTFTQDNPTNTPLRYRNAAVYTDAADNTTGYFSGNSESAVGLGQRFNVSYFVGQEFYKFTTSSLTGATIVAAALRLDGRSDTSTQDFTVGVHSYTYTGGSSPDDTDFRRASQLGTPIGTWSSADYSSAYNTITVTAGSVNTSGVSGYALASERQRSLTAPNTDGTREDVWFGSDFGGDPGLLDVSYLVGTPLTADAVLRKTQTASFTADAVISAVLAFTADAVIRRERTGTLVTDALLRKTTSVTFTADAWIDKAFTANAVKKKTFAKSFSADARILAHSFTASAYIVAAPVPPGTKIAAVIKVNGVDITDDVIIRGATFTQAVNARPGQFQFEVKDDDHIYNFVSGGRVTLDIQNRRAFDGYLDKATVRYAFPVDITTAPSETPRIWRLEGPDLNILFSKRIIFDQVNPNADLPTYPSGTTDVSIIRDFMRNYVDLDGDDITYDGITHVGSPNPDADGYIIPIGSPWGAAMAAIGQLPGAVWGLTQDRDLFYEDDSTESAPFRLSDTPDNDESYGYRDFTWTDDGTRLVNDAQVWGAGTGSSEIVYAETIDASSVAEHGRWQQPGQFRSDMFRQATVNDAADSIVYGSPQNLHGGKDPYVLVECTIKQHGLRAGHKVRFINSVYGLDKVIPIRRLTITFVNLYDVMYRLELTQEIDEPWFFAEFAGYTFPPFRSFPDPPKSKRIRWRWRERDVDCDDRLNFPIEVLVKTRVQGTLDGNPVNMNVVLSQSASIGSNEVQGRIGIEEISGGSSVANERMFVTGKGTFGGSSFTPAGTATLNNVYGLWFWLKMRLEPGLGVLGKIWLDGAGEPGWQSTASGQYTRPYGLLDTLSVNTSLGTAFFEIDSIAVTGWSGTVTDTFARTVGSGWGTSEFGLPSNNWNTGSGTLSVGSGVAKIGPGTSSVSITFPTCGDLATPVTRTALSGAYGCESATRVSSTEYSTSLPFISGTTEVYLNGRLMRPTYDYIESTLNSLEFTLPVDVSDVVYVCYYSIGLSGIIG